MGAVVVPVEAMSLSGLVDLVNGWGTVPRREAGEADWPFPPVADLDGRLGLIATPPPTDRVLIQVADRIYPVFGAEVSDERAALVDRMLAETAVRPALPACGDPAWAVAAPDRALLAAAAVALRTQLAEHAADRLGVCRGRRCADVYVDASPGGHRRFCSVTCQNRARVAAFRARRATKD